LFPEEVDVSTGVFPDCLNPNDPFTCWMMGILWFISWNRSRFKKKGLDYALYVINVNQTTKDKVNHSLLLNRYYTMRPQETIYELQWSDLKG